METIRCSLETSPTTMTLKFYNMSSMSFIDGLLAKVKYWQMLGDNKLNLSRHVEKILGYIFRSGKGLSNVTALTFFYKSVNGQIDLPVIL